MSDKADNFSATPGEQARADQISEEITRLMRGQPLTGADPLSTIAREVRTLPADPSPDAVREFNQRVDRWFSAAGRRQPSTLRRYRFSLIAAWATILVALIAGALFIRTIVLNPPVGALTPTTLPKTLPSITQTPTVTPSARPTTTGSSTPSQTFTPTPTLTLTATHRPLPSATQLIVPLTPRPTIHLQPTPEAPQPTVSEPTEPPQPTERQQSTEPPQPTEVHAPTDS